VKVERGDVYAPSAALPAPFDTGSYGIEGTRVTISYPYKWEFNKVIGLLVPGASYASTSQISGVGVMQNLN
jgi:hypothetical protein